MRTILVLLPLLLLGAACGGSDKDADPGTLAIYSVYPESGPEAGDQPVAVGGSGFLIGIDEVLFDGRRATDIEVTSDNNINCRTPAHAADTVDVEVVTVTGESVILTNGYTYSAPPRILAVTPVAGSPGLTVSIVGIHFADLSGRAPTVLFGDQESPLPQLVNPTLIFATVPGGQPGPGLVDVTVINDNGDDTLQNGFAYVTGTLNGSLPTGEEILEAGYELIETIVDLGGVLLPGLDLPTQEQILGVFRDALAAR